MPVPTLTAFTQVRILDWWTKCKAVQILTGPLQQLRLCCVLSVSPTLCTVSLHHGKLLLFCLAVLRPASVHISANTFPSLLRLHELLFSRKEVGPHSLYGV